MRLYHGDCIEVLREIPDQSVALVLTDPPYNIGKATWDNIPNYIGWCISWLTECQRVLKPNGVLYLWHNDIPQIAQLMEAIRVHTDFAFRSFCVWSKGSNYRYRLWGNRKPDGPTSPRSWINICEYCLHFVRAPQAGARKYTGTQRINSDPACYNPIKDWYDAELARLGLTKKDIARQYTQVTGKKPYMLRHYFQDSQFEIPRRSIYEAVYKPLGFVYPVGTQNLQSDYNALRQQYEALRQQYEALRYTHHCDAMHCNVWQVPPVTGGEKRHPCQKPLAILERIIRVSSNPGDVVLDCFMGSGSTGVAAVHMGRDFIGVEQDRKTFEAAREWISAETPGR